MSDFRRRLMMSVKKANKENKFDYEEFYSNYVMVTDDTGLKSNLGRIVLKLKPCAYYNVTTNLSYNNNESAIVFVAAGSNLTMNLNTKESGVLQNTTRTVQSDENGCIVVGIYTSGANAVEKEKFASGEAWVKIIERNAFDYEEFYSNYIMVTDDTGLKSNLGRIVLKLKPCAYYNVTTNLSYNNNESAIVFVAAGSNLTMNLNTKESGVLQNTTRTVQSDENGYIVVGIFTAGANAVEKEKFASGEAWVKIIESEE